MTPTELTRGCIENGMVWGWRQSASRVGGRSVYVEASKVGVTTNGVASWHGRDGLASRMDGPAAGLGLIASRSS